MARVGASTIFGRFSFFALMIAQCFLLASYPATYQDKPAWYAVSILFIPAVGFWFWISAHQTSYLYHVFFFWTVYIWLGLVPIIGIVFISTHDKIENKGFWNPSTLKMTLCITPLLLLMMFHTKTSPDDFPHRVSWYSVKSTINLYDGIDLIGVILDGNESNSGIPWDFKNTLVAFACLSFLCWPLVLGVDFYTLDDDRNNPRWIIYYAFQLGFELIFLGLRLGLCLSYDKTASIFINKNMVMIIVHTREILNLFCDLRR